MKKIEFLKANGPKPKTDIIGLVSIISICGCFAIFLFISGIVINIISEEDKVFQIVQFTLAFFVGFFGNILSSLLMEKRQKKRIKIQEMDELNRIMEISDINLINEILNDINVYGQRIIENYVIDASLNNYKENDYNESFFFCNATFKYKKRVFNNRLIFQFVRNRGIEDTMLIEQQEKESNMSFFTKEFYYTFNEWSFGTLPEEERIYKLIDLRINNKPVTFYRNGTPSHNNIIEYYADLPTDLKIGEMASIEYKIQFIIESESHLFFVVELPAKEVICKLTYADVSSKIDISAYDFLTSKMGGNFEHKKDHGIFTFHTDAWVLPKSNFCFTWYQK